MTGNSNSGAPRKLTCQRNGRLYVALDSVGRLYCNGVTFERKFTLSEEYLWFVDDKRFTDYAAAAAEFERSVSGG